ncbi:MAG TPA: helix-turn-helix transcriptional regulator [bacterium]|nr:helix-turn-helix transcriptional regulator [bacterium]
MVNDDRVKISKDLGERIRKAREEASLTQLEVATTAGIDVNYYARIERGLGNPSYLKLHNIAKVLNIELFSKK